MAKKEDTSKKADHRRPNSNKVKLHRYYKTIIASQKTPEQKACSKRMWIGLLKELGPIRVG